METAQQIKDFGLEIKFARIRKGLKQYELAAQLGIRPGKLAQIENGFERPEPEVLAALQKALELQAEP